MRERQQMEKMIKMKRNGGDEKKMRVGDWQVEWKREGFGGKYIYYVIFQK